MSTMELRSNRAGQKPPIQESWSRESRSGETGPREAGLREVVSVGRGSGERGSGERGSGERGSGETWALWTLILACLLTLGWIAFFAWFNARAVGLI